MGRWLGKFVTNNSKCTQAVRGVGRNVLGWNAAVITLQLFTNRTQSLGNTVLFVCVSFTKDRVT